MKGQKAKKNKIFAFRYLLHDVFKWLAAVPGLLWFRPRYVYATPAAKKKTWGGVLVTANHVSVYDPVRVYYAVPYRRLRFVAMKELFEKKFGNWFLRTNLCIPIDRERFSLATFKEIVRTLRDGHAVAMFPEGKINTEGDGLQAFKTGAAVMAIKGNVPVLPVYIKPRGSVWPRTVIVVGEPIDLVSVYGDRPTQEQIAELTERLHAAEEALREIAERRGKTGGKRP